MSSSFLPSPETVYANDIKLAVYRAGKKDGQAVIFLHGFPATALSLHHQFHHLAALDYNCLAIDQRGFGLSDCPAEVSEYRMTRLVDDVLAVMHHFELQDAFLVGHDWGGAVAWQAALVAPERIAGVISLGTILFPRADEEPIAARRALMGDRNYVVAFQTPGEADELLDRDVGRTLDFMFRKNYMTMEQFAEADQSTQRFELLKEFRSGDFDGQPLLSKDERAEMVAAFERTGFSPGINWYRNITANWQNSAGQDMHLNQRCLLISGRDDYFSPPSYAAMSKPLLPRLEHIVIPGGHWFPMEYPGETNRRIESWLKSRNSKDGV